MNLFFVLSSSQVLDLERKKKGSIYRPMWFFSSFPLLFPHHFFEGIMYLILEPTETSFIAESFPVI